MGRMGLWHAKDLKSKVPGVELVAVSDVDKAAAVRASRELGVPWYQDYRKLLALKDLDAVCIVTSTDTHAPISTEAAELGMNVLERNLWPRQLRTQFDWQERLRNLG